MPTSAPVHCLKPPCLPRLQQPGLCQAAGRALCFRLGSQLAGWEEAIGLLGSEGAMGFFALAELPLPPYPDPGAAQALRSGLGAWTWQCISGPTQDVLDRKSVV